jgi:glutamine cyclotransferase
LRKVDLETGQVVEGYYYALPGQYFGEGITIFDQRIIQLTWLASTGFVYDKDAFASGPIEQFSYLGEGWGITHDGTHLIMSNGSSWLYYWHPTTFDVIGFVEVIGDQGPVVRLNELEYIDGLVYANVWLTNRIAIIDPQTGAVTAWIDLAGLLSPEEAQSADWLNGIAYDAAGDRLFVTGKLWPKLFEIELVPPHYAYLPRVRR